MKRFSGVLLLFLLACLLGGCQVEVQEVQSEGVTGYYFYYLNTDETELVRETYTPESEAAQSMIQELMQSLSSPDTGEGQTAILPSEVAVNNYELGEDGVLTIDFNSRYSEMTKSREILVRAGVVKSFVQIPGVRAVVFTVGGEPLTDSRGEAVGEMNGETFVSYPGEDMDAYRDDTFILYFADREGEHLVREERKLYYRKDIPKEQVVLEQLSAGPMNRGSYPTVPESLGINDIVISDRICYIDFDRSFIDYDQEISPQVLVYSVVNSVIDACEADMVQISIDGSTSNTLLEGMDLYHFYEKNEGLVVVEAEESE